MDFCCCLVPSAKIFFSISVQTSVWCVILSTSNQRGNWFGCSVKREDKKSKIYKPSSGAALSAISNGLRVFFLVNTMNKVELSLFIEANYPRNKSSIAMRKPLHGIGVNDADYVTTPLVNGVMLWDPAYRAWSSMMHRAYSKNTQSIQPTYVGVTVCKEWHSFSAFRAWWLNNYREGFSLDKDLLVISNREYGPDSCIYVPQWLNTFTIDCGALRGEFPIGVSLHKPTGKYTARCCNPITGKKHHLGSFTTPEEAHEAWLKYKLELAAQLKPEMDSIDPRIYNNVVTIIKAAI